MTIPSPQFSLSLLDIYISKEPLKRHCRMVAKAMKAYATALDKSEKTQILWWTAGLLHDLDWEKFPEEHPNKAINEWLPKHNYSNEILDAIAAHAPERTHKKPITEIERYLFACDEISGFMHAVSLMRPNGFKDMKVKSVKKKLNDKRFAASVNRADIQLGAELIKKKLEEHINFLILVFTS